MINASDDHSRPSGEASSPPAPDPQAGDVSSRAEPRPPSVDGIDVRWSLPPEQAAAGAAAAERSPGVAAGAPARPTPVLASRKRTMPFGTLEAYRSPALASPALDAGALGREEQADPAGPALRSVMLSMSDRETLPAPKAAQTGVSPAAASVPDLRGVTGAQPTAKAASGVEAARAREPRARQAPRPAALATAARATAKGPGPAGRAPEAPSKRDGSTRWVNYVAAVVGLAGALLLAAAVLTPSPAPEPVSRGDAPRTVDTAQVIPTAPPSTPVEAPTNAAPPATQDEPATPAPTFAPGPRRPPATAPHQARPREGIRKLEDLKQPFR